MSKHNVEKETLKEELRNVFEEARLILPGIQALFGFQTVAVFSQRFVSLPEVGQIAHLIALAMIIIAIGIIMTPASYHRIVDPGWDSRRKILLSAKLICIALFPLACGIAVDTFVVTLLATTNRVLSMTAGMASFIILVGCWFVFPFWVRAKRKAIDTK